MIGTKQSIVDETGLTFIPDGVYEDLKQFDLLYVPGGVGTRSLMHEAASSTTSRAGPRTSH